MVAACTARFPSSLLLNFAPIFFDTERRGGANYRGGRVYPGVEVTFSRGLHKGPFRSGYVSLQLHQLQHTSYNSFTYIHRLDNRYYSSLYVSTIQPFLLFFFCVLTLTKTAPFILGACPLRHPVPSVPVAPSVRFPRQRDNNHSLAAAAAEKQIMGAADFDDKLTIPL